MDHYDVTVIGAGLAGSEAAYVLARSGMRVRLVEMKPLARTPAQKSDFCAELVCSNSLRSNNPANAVGLLKEELWRLGSLIVGAAYAHRVPAGDALAVDRDGFGRAVEAALAAEPHITKVTGVQQALPPPDAGPVIVATGPLTAGGLAQALMAPGGGLYFYDALAPIVAGDSIDRDIAFAASRYDKGDGADYLNCPLDKSQYEAFAQALVQAPCAPHHSFEAPKFFQGCMPLEEVARSGPDALRFGALKPVGLYDRRKKGRAYAVVQLRQEDIGGQAFNLVGCQTKLLYPAQKRVFGMIPGLQEANFLRLGAMHRNTFIDSPRLLDSRMRLLAQPNVHIAGQLTGVEGYVESAAHGHLVARLVAAAWHRRPVSLPPSSTAVGALLGHVRGARRLPGRPHEPSNITWAMFDAAPNEIRKRDNKTWRLAAARKNLESWAAQADINLGPPPQQDLSCSHVDAAG